MAIRKTLTALTVLVLLVCLSVPALAVSEGIVRVGEGNILRVRAKMSTSAEVIDMLPDGKAVEVVKDAGDGWYQVRIGDTLGYVSSAYLEVDGKLSGTQDDEPEQETPESTTAAPTAIAAGSYVKVTAASLNLRSGPGESNSRVGALAQGKIVKVLAVEGEWYKVEGGYICARYTTLAGETETESVDLYLKVTTASLNIRSGPGTGYDKVGSLSEGKVVKATGSRDGWYKIDKGFISADYVKKTDKPASSSSSTKTVETVCSVAPSTTGEAMAQLALQYVGYSYVYGGSRPSTGFDCSGLVQYVCAQYGYSINRTASDQLKNGVSVSMSELAPGDLVFFKKPGSTTSKPVTHVGMYIGDGKFVHASDYDTGVKISKLSDSYYTVGFVAARRIAK